MLSFGSCDSTRARNEKRRSHCEAAVTIRPGATCGAPPAQCHAHAGRGSPRPSAGERDLPCKLVPQGTGASGPRWPRLPLTRRRWTRFSLRSPTHTHTMLTLGFADRLPRESFDRTFIFKAKLRVTTGWARRDCRGSGRDSSPPPVSALCPPVLVPGDARAKASREAGTRWMPTTVTGSAVTSTHVYCWRRPHRWPARPQPGRAAAGAVVCCGPPGKRGQRVRGTDGRRPLSRPSLGC